MSRREDNWARDGSVALLLFVGVFFAVFYQDAVLAAILGVGIATVLVAEYYDRFAGRRLGFRVSVRPRRLFPDEQATLTFTARNPDRLPLPFLRALVHLPRRAELPEAELQRSPQDSVLALPLTLGGRRTYTRSMPMYVRQRGFYPLGPVDAIVWDPFGMRDALRMGREASSVLVYPRLRPIGADLKKSLPIGDRRGRSFLDEETHYLGPRAYQPTDPLRRIDWRQTARRGDLYVKTYETVATSATALFLDPTTARNPWDGIDTAVIEETVEITASLCSDLITRGQAVGLYVSGVFTESGGRRPFSFRERPRTGARQLSLLLEALAQVKPPGLFRDLPRILAEEVPRLPYHVHVVVITPYLDAALQEALLRAAHSHRVYYLQTGPEDPRDVAIPPGVRPLRVLAR